MRALMLLALLAPGCIWVSKEQLCADEPGLEACGGGETGESPPDDSTAPDDSTPPDADGDGVTADQDCDDGDPSRYPGAEEVCDGVDQDCDEEVDEGVTGTWYADADEDGYGDDTTARVESCAAEGEVDQGGDCDDGDSEIWETCGELRSGWYKLTPDDDSDDIVLLSGINAGDQAGTDVDAADWDGDGEVEVAVSAPYYDGSSGLVAVIEAPLDFDSADLSLGDESVRTIANPLTSYGDAGRLGGSVHWMEPLAGDDYPLLALGAAGWGTDGALQRGAVVLFEGPTGDDWAQISGEPKGYSYFGSALTSGPLLTSEGDTGDEASDPIVTLVVGAVEYPGYPDYTGRVYLLADPAMVDVAMPDGADLILTGSDTDYGFGTAVDDVGDTDGAGRDDLLVGAYCSPADPIDYICVGAAYLCRDMDAEAGSISAVDADVTLAGDPKTGTANSEYAGTLVLGPGDINADGYDDLLVSAPFHDEPGNRSGALYVISGTVSASGQLATQAEAVITGENDDDTLGYGRHAASSAGDVDGDGYVDLWIGAPEDPFSDGTSTDEPGRVFLLMGASNLADIGTLDDAFVEIEGADVGDATGNSVVSVDDLNHDGCSDLLIGAFQHDTTTDSAGRAWLVSGCTE